MTASRFPRSACRRYLNHPRSVSLASCKIDTFKILTEKGLSCVPWTLDKNEAVSWKNDKKMVVARTLTRASEGRGAIFLEPDQEIVPAPLYTQYVKKKAEFRVNVAFGTIVNIRQKKRRTQAHTAGLHLIACSAHMLAILIRSSPLLTFWPSMDHP